MTPEFPLTIDTVSSVLTVVAPTAKHVEKLRDFIQGKLPPGFPVKLDMPVFPTVTARVSFRAYRPLTPEDDNVFDVPEGFRRVNKHRVEAGAVGGPPEAGAVEGPPEAAAAVNVAFDASSDA